MKKTLFVAVLLALATGTMMAQNQNREHGKMHKEKMSQEQRIEKRVEGLCNKLMLSDKESAQFSVMYKDYLKALKDCRPARNEKQEGMKSKERKPLTDEQIMARMKSRYESEKKVAEVKLAYMEKFSKILSARQVQMVMQDKPKMRQGMKNGKHFGNFPGGPGKMMPQGQCKDCPKNHKPQGMDQPADNGLQEVPQQETVNVN